jgi:integrase/recombinase XerD
MKWSAEPVLHKNEKRIVIRFEFSNELVARVKKLEGVKWSNSMKTWHVPDTEQYRKRFKLPNCESYIDDDIYTKHAPLLNQTDGPNQIDIYSKVIVYKNWLRSRRYSVNTVKTYSEALLRFLKYYSHKPITEINNNDVIMFNNDFILEHNLSASYQNQVVNAIKLFFRKIENSALNVDVIHRPKRAKQLPNVLSKMEVKALLDSLNNIKHKAMLSLIYSCGLRCSELINMRIRDVDSKRNLLVIKNAKGRKDRIAPLSDKTIKLLREYFKVHKPLVYLFEGQIHGEPYDARSLQLVLKVALAKTKIKRPVTLHWLRHSYATHLLEAGTDLRYIQEILGHKSSRTTEIYTHVSTRSIQKIISPFDDL